MAPEMTNSGDKEAITGGEKDLLGAVISTTDWRAWNVDWTEVSQKMGIANEAASKKRFNRLIQRRGWNFAPTGDAPKGATGRKQKLADRDDNDEDKDLEQAPAKKQKKTQKATPVINRKAAVPSMIPARCVIESRPKIEDEDEGDNVDVDEDDAAENADV